MKKSLLISLFSIFIIVNIFSQSIPKVHNIKWAFKNKQLNITCDVVETYNRSFDLDIQIVTKNNTIYKPKKAVTGNKSVRQGPVIVKWWYDYEGYSKSLFEDNISEIIITPVNLPIIETKKNKSKIVQIINQPSIVPLTLKRNQSELTWLSAFGRDKEIFNVTKPPFRVFDYRNLDTIPRLSITNLSYVRGFTTDGAFSGGLSMSYFTSNISDNSFSLGPTIRWRPLAGTNDNIDLTITNTLRFNFGNEDVGKMISENQITFYHHFKALNVVTSIQGSMNFSNPPNQNIVSIQNQLTFLIGYFPRTNILTFASINFSNRSSNVIWNDNNERFILGKSTSFNLGVQWTLLNQYHLYGGYSFEIAKSFGGEFPFLFIGVRTVF